jgi:hypothetical protein
MLNAKVGHQRVGASAVLEIGDQRESSGQCDGASVDGAVRSREQRDAAGTRELPESGCGFESQDADGELLMTHDCPEGKKRLKAKC